MNPARPRRALVSETVDPDGAMVGWLTPELRALGWDALAAPTQEVIGLLGRDGYGQWLLAVVREWRPDVVFIHPPYDHLSDADCRTIRALGASLVAFAFDDALFAPQAGAESDDGAESASIAASAAASAKWCQSITRRYDRYLTTDPATAQRLALAGVTTASWHPFACPMVPPAAVASRLGIANAAILIGRPYTRRVALVNGLAAAGIPVHVFGHGWQGVPDLAPSVVVSGPVDGDEMAGLLAQAGVVITTGGWEQSGVPMVKYRLLEAALAGACQAVEWAPELPRYFPDDVLFHWSDGPSLAAACRRALADPAAARARGRRARSHAETHHLWRHRWPQLVATLRPNPHAVAGTEGPSDAWCAMIASLAHGAEAHGQLPLAKALLEHWRRAAPDRPGAAVALARVHLATGDHLQCARWCERAWSLIKAADGAEATGSGQLPMVHLPVSGGRLGLGRAGHLEPRPELLAMTIASLLATGRPARAIEYLVQLDGQPALAIATARLLRADGDAENAGLWRALMGRALAAAQSLRSWHGIQAVTTHEAQRWSAVASD